MSTTPNIQALSEQAAAAIESGDPADAKRFAQAAGMQPSDFQAQLQAQGPEQLALTVQAMRREFLGRTQAAMAEKAWEAYDFGEGVTVVGRDGWEYYAVGHERSCRVYLEAVSIDGKDKPPPILGLRVRFDPQTGLMTEVHALDFTDSIWGQFPEGKMAELNLALADWAPAQSNAAPDLADGAPAADTETLTAEMKVERLTKLLVGMMNHTVIDMASNSLTWGPDDVNEFREAREGLEEMGVKYVYPNKDNTPGFGI